MNHSRARERINLKQVVEGFPCQTGPMRAPTKPLGPDSADCKQKSIQRIGVEGDPIILIVALNLPAEHFVLNRDLQIAVPLAPKSDGFNGLAESICRCFPLNNP